MTIDDPTGAVTVSSAAAMLGGPAIYRAVAGGLLGLAQERTAADT